VKKLKKGAVYFKIFHQNIRGLGNKAGEVNSFSSKLPSCYVPNRTSPKVFTTGEV